MHLCFIYIYKLCHEKITQFSFSLVDYKNVVVAKSSPSSNSVMYIKCFLLKIILFSVKQNKIKANVIILKRRYENTKLCYVRNFECVKIG